MAEFVCSICLYASFPKTGDDDRLTVVDGQLVCVDHVDYAAGNTHSLAIVVLRRAEANLDA